jgi:hypothetical protein
MKELLTEWRKFVNEVGDPYSYYTPSHWRQVFSHPDTTIDTLIDRLIRNAGDISSLLYPDDPEEYYENPDGWESAVEKDLEDINNYARVWFKNHEVKEEDEDKAKAIKTFVDWFNRNIDEMIEVSKSEDYDDVMDSKAHKILRRITDDETGNMLVALGAQLDKF